MLPRLVFDTTWIGRTAQSDMQAKGTGSQLGPPNPPFTFQLFSRQQALMRTVHRQTHYPDWITISHVKSESEKHFQCCFRDAANKWKLLLVIFAKGITAISLLDFWGKWWRDLFIQQGIRRHLLHSNIKIFPSTLWRAASVTVDECQNLKLMPCCQIQAVVLDICLLYSADNIYKRIQCIEGAPECRFCIHANFRKFLWVTLPISHFSPACGPRERKHSFGRVVSFA